MRKVSEDSTLSKHEKTSKRERKKERCQGEDEMMNKDTKQNEKKKRKKERTASYHHLVVPAGTDNINANSNVNENVNAHEEVVEEHTVAATEQKEEGNITDTDENVTSLEGMPVLRSPPPVNSKRKQSEAYTSKNHEKWNRQFMDLVEYKATNGHCNIPTKSGSLGIWVSKQRVLFRCNKLKADRHDKLVEIGFTFDHESNEWNRHFMELVKYKETNGNCNIPIRNGSLGSWIARQRELFRSKELKADRCEKLVGIGFMFEAALEFKGKLDQQWQNMYQKLLEYKETNGHCFDVPQTLSFARWLNQQRQFYRNGNLREDRAEKLISIGFDDKKVLKKGGAVGVHDATSGQPPRKNRKVEDLDNDSAAITNDEGEEGIDIINANGDDNDNGNVHEEVMEEHIVVATELVEEGSITDKDGNVTSLEGMPALHSPPPVNSKRKYNQAYGSKFHENWNRCFMELVEYKEKNGHCNRPENKGSLGRWIRYQRSIFKSKKLKADRYEKLVEIGFAFEDALEFKGKFDQKWQEMYQKLLEHKETNGHCFNVPQTLPLARWLNHQRCLYRNGKLREDRAEKLLSVGFNDKKVLKKGGAVGVRDASSRQPPRKKRKVEDLDNDLTTINHDEGEKGIDDINAEDDVNDNVDAHEEVVEEHTVAATELVEEGIKEGLSLGEVAPPLEENNEIHIDGPAVSV
eukprot:scaffold453_cov278-Chaetoceros_neogracile.AAC.28